MALQSFELKAPSVESDVRRVDLHTRRARAFGALAQWAAAKPDLEQALRYLDEQQSERRCGAPAGTDGSVVLVARPYVGRATWPPRRWSWPNGCIVRILPPMRSGGWPTRDRATAISSVRSRWRVWRLRARGAPERSPCHAPAQSLPRRARDRRDRVRCPRRRDGPASHDETFTMYALSHHGLSLGERRDDMPRRQRSSMRFGSSAASTACSRCSRAQRRWLPDSI